MTTTSVTVTELVDECLAAWTAHDLDRLAASFAVDCTVVDVALDARRRGRDGLRAYAQEVLAGFPDLHLAAESVVADGHRAAVAWRLTGTQAGAVRGLPPLGQPCTIRGMSALTVHEGLVDECTSYWDMLGLLWQLGHAV